MLKTHPVIRAEMTTRGLTIRDLGKLAIIPERTLSSRLIYETEWRIGEQYRVMDALGIPESRMHETFPRRTKCE